MKKQEIKTKKETLLDKLQEMQNEYGSAESQKTLDKIIALSKKEDSLFNREAEMEIDKALINKHKEFNKNSNEIKAKVAKYINKQLDGSAHILVILNQSPLGVSIETITSFDKEEQIEIFSKLVEAMKTDSLPSEEGTLGTYSDKDKEWDLGIPKGYDC